MSLVGTRPPTVDEWDKYELHHRARLATKPGLSRGYVYELFRGKDQISESAIYRVAETRVDIIIRDKSLILDDMLLSELLEKSSCNKYDKIELWAKAIPNLNEESCKEHFDELGFPELKGIFTKRNNYRKTYEKNIYTTKIFEELKKNGWIMRTVL